MNRTLLFLTFFLLLVSCSGNNNNFLPYQNTTEKYIKLNGNIDSQLIFNVSVVYSAKSDLKECKNFGPMMGTYAQTKSLFYLPKLTNGKYELIIPLREIDPSTTCKWTPDMIQLCAGPTHSTPDICSPLVYFERPGHTLGKVTDVICNFTKNQCRKEFLPPKLPYEQLMNQSHKVNFSVEHNI